MAAVADSRENESNAKWNSDYPAYLVIAARLFHDDICAEMKKMGHAMSLNLDLISADHLR